MSEDPSSPREVPFFGEFYRRTTAPLLPERVSAEEALFILRTLDLRPTTRVLDLGCGEGRHLRYVGPAARATGVDLDLGALQVASGHAAVCGGDLRALPFETGSFDAVYCWYSTLFVFDEAGNQRALEEAARVLVPGGRLLVQTVNPRRLAEAPETAFETTLPDGSRLVERSRFDARSGRDFGLRTLVQPNGESVCARYAIRYYSLPQLTALFRTAGLRILNVFGGVTGERFEDPSLDLIALGVKEDHG